MDRTPLSVPEIAIIAGTRAALGAGLGLLLADRLNEDQRRAVGWTLFGVGVLTTVPIALQLFRHPRTGHATGTTTSGVGPSLPAAPYRS